MDKLFHLLLSYLQFPILHHLLLLSFYRFHLFLNDLSLAHMNIHMLLLLCLPLILKILILGSLFFYQIFVMDHIVILFHFKLILLFHLIQILFVFLLNFKDCDLQLIILFEAVLHPYCSLSKYFLNFLD